MEMSVQELVKRTEVSEKHENWDDIVWDLEDNEDFEDFENNKVFVQGIV